MYVFLKNDVAENQVVGYEKAYGFMRNSVRRLGNLLEEDPVSFYGKFWKFY